MSQYYKQGQDRNQALLFPPSINDYVDKNNNVRAIDMYVDTLNIKELKFTDTRKSNKLDGQKAYSPTLLLKIYIYGYINKIRSSRMLERECKRNIEMIWLTQGLTPTYRTISEFRASNPKALKQVFKEFVLLCENIDLIGDGIKAVDGAFLRANASKNVLITKKTIDKDLIKINKDITDYLTSLEFSDKEHQSYNKINNLPKDLRKLKHKRQELSSNLKLLEELKQTQYNKTDPDAKLMIKPAHNLIAYNSQIVVDDKHKLIVATDVTSQGTDVKQIHSMAIETKENLKLSKSDTLDIVGDTGYYSGKELKKCIDDNINAYIPQAKLKLRAEDKGVFPRDKFMYDRKKDLYVCPNNEVLKKSLKPQLKNDKKNYVYRASTSSCKNCPLKDKCIPNKTKYKQMYRWEHEKIVDEHKLKMSTQKAKDIVRRRGSIVEHPFGTIKRTLGWDHFLVRGKDKVSGENALLMFTYNFKRILNIIGIELFKKLTIDIQNGDIKQIKKDIGEYILCFSLYLGFYFGIIFIGLIFKRKLVIFSK